MLIHTGDPLAFFEPLDERNERLEELPSIPTGGSATERGSRRSTTCCVSFERLVASHPRTTFIGAHVAGAAEDLAWVDRMLTTYPNLHVDIAARIAELGRQPRATRALIERHPTRMLFGTDEFPPTQEIYAIHFRFLETADEHFAYSIDDPPPQGRWAISGLDLSDDLLSGRLPGQRAAADPRARRPGLVVIGGARPEIRPDAAVRGLFVTSGFVDRRVLPVPRAVPGRQGAVRERDRLVIAAMAVARIVLNPIWGHISDSVLGRRTSLQIGLVLAAGCALVAQRRRHDLWAIAAAGFLLAGAMVTFGPNIDAITLEHLGAERMSEYGRIRSWESFTYAIGCFVLGATFQLYGVRWAMPIYADRQRRSCSPGRSRVTRDAPKHESKGDGKLGSVGAVFRAAPRFWGFLAALLLVWIGFNAAWNFISLKIAERGRWTVARRASARRSAAWSRCR